MLLPVDLGPHSLINPFRTAVPFWGQTTQILSNLSPKWDCGPKRVNKRLKTLLYHCFDISRGPSRRSYITLFRTAVPFWRFGGQTTYSLKGLSRKRDCSTNRRVICIASLRPHSRCGDKTLVIRVRIRLMYTAVLIKGLI